MKCHQGITARHIWTWWLNVINGKSFTIRRMVILLTTTGWPKK